MWNIIYFIYSKSHADLMDLLDLIRLVDVVLITSLRWGVVGIG